MVDRNLSKRLEILSRGINEEDVVADIGTDHGKLPLYLSRNRAAKKVIASDISKASIQKLIEEKTEDDDIDVVISDGLMHLKGQTIDKIVIAGMGGPLICQILDPEELQHHQQTSLILQPNTQWEMVRKHLHRIGYRIVTDELIFDRDYYYPIITAEKGEEAYDMEIYYYYGKMGFETSSMVLKSYLRMNEARLLAIMDQLERDQRSMDSPLKEELTRIREAISHFEIQTVRRIY